MKMSTSNSCGQVNLLSINEHTGIIILAFLAQAMNNEKFLLNTKHTSINPSLTFVVVEPES